MLGIPITFYTTEAVTRVPSFSLPGPRLGDLLRFGNLSIVILLGIAFLATTADRSFPYFSNFAPTSMLQNSVPLGESQSVARSFSWVSQNIQTGSALMVIHPLYGWSRLFFQAGEPMLSYEPGVTLKTALMRTLGSGYNTVYTVWWVNSEGWYGETSVPNG